MIKRMICVLLLLVIPTTASAAKETDAELIARLIYSEARDQGYEGQLVVAQCVLDRLAYGSWGNTIRKVIYAENQFAAPGKLTDEYLKVAQAALDGERYSYDYDILYFQVTKSKKDWYAPYIEHVGDHAIYGYKIDKCVDICSCT